MTPTSVDGLVDRVADAVLAVPGVSALHAGPYGVGTYLPGRRVAGLRIGERLTEVHVSITLGTVAPDVAGLITAAVAPLTGTAVEVHVEDVTTTTTEPPLSRSSS